MIRDFENEKRKIMKETEDKINRLQAKQKNPDYDFEDRREKILFATLGILSLLSLLSFKFFPVLFGFSIQLLLISGALITLIEIDKIFFQSNTIKKISENAIAISIFFFALFYLFVNSAELGNSWIDPRSTIEDNTRRVEQRTNFSTESDNSASYSKTAK